MQYEPPPSTGASGQGQSQAVVMVMLLNSVVVSIGDVVTPIVMIMISVYLRNVCPDCLNVFLDF